MATGKSGYFDIAGDRGFTVRIHWAETYDILTNKSNLSITSMQFQSTTWAYTWFPGGTISVDGTVVKEMNYNGYATHMFSATANETWHEVVRANAGKHGEDPYPWSAGEFTHNADGTKSITFSVDLNLYSALDRPMPIVKGTYTIALTTIPRVSTLTISNGTLGVAQTVKVTRQSTSFSHKITTTCGEYINSWKSNDNEITTVTSWNWIPSLEIAKQNTTGTSLDATITIETFAENGSSIGTKSYSVKLTIPQNDKTKPTVSIATSDPNEYLSTFDGYVQNKSTCKVALTSSGKYGATIKSYSITCGASSSTKSSATFNLPTSGIIPITVKVTDSRGMSATATSEITVLAYNSPKVTKLNAYRSDSSGTASPAGSNMSVVFSASVTSLSSNNTATYKIQYRKSGATSWSSKTPSASGYSPTDNSTVITSVATDSSYDVRVAVTDVFGTVYSVVTTVLSAYALAHLDKGNNRIGLGKVAEGNDILDVGLDARFRGNVTFDNFPIDIPMTLEQGGTGTDMSSIAQGRVIAMGNGKLSYWAQVPIAQGGTGATTALAARKALGARIFYTLAELGMTTFPTTMKDVVAAMPNNSMLVVDSRNILSGGTEEISNLGITFSGIYVFMRGNSNARVSLMCITGSTSATSNFIQYGCYAATDDAVIWNYVQRESSTANCYYRVVDGYNEWINPPLQLGTEYRTTERHRGKIVYTKAVDMGTVTNGAVYKYHDSTVYPIRYAAYNNGGIALPLFMEVALNSSYKAWVDVKYNEITARFNTGFSSLRIYAQIWYTKT